MRLANDTALAATRLSIIMYDAILRSRFRALVTRRYDDGTRSPRVYNAYIVVRNVNIVIFTE